MKKRILVSSLIILFVIIAGQFILHLSFVSKFEQATFDYRAKKSVDSGVFGRKFKNADKRIVIVGIDDASKKELLDKANLNYETWPWPRDVWCKVVDFIEGGSPESIMFNMVFSDLDSNINDDTQFSRTLKQYDNIILGTAFESPKIANGVTQKAISDNDYIPTSAPLDVVVKDKNVDDAITYYQHSSIHNIYTRSNQMGVVNKTEDSDNVTRKVQPIFKLIQNGKTYYMPSLSFAGFLQYYGADGKIVIQNGKIKYKGFEIPIDNKGRCFVGWHSLNSAYTYVPISKIMLSEQDNKYINPAFFQNKIVIIGRAVNNSDIRKNAISAIYNDPALNAAALDNYINDSTPGNKHARKFVTQMPNLSVLGLTFILALGVGLITWITPSAILGLFFGLLGSCLYSVMNIWFFVNPATRLILPFAWPLYYLIMVAVAVFIYRCIFPKNSTEKVVVDKVLANVEKASTEKRVWTLPKISIPKLNFKFNKVSLKKIKFERKEKTPLKSDKKNITILSLKVKNFSKLAEISSTEKLLAGLNGMFNAIVPIVTQNKGVVDKCFGETFIAYWDDVSASQEDAYLAVKVAMEIKKKVNELKIANAKENKLILDVEIAINKGEAILGLTGFDKKLKYTVMGEAFNLANMLVSSCSKLNRDILISKTTYDRVKDKIVVLDAGNVDILDKVINVYEPLGLKDKSVESGNQVSDLGKIS